MQIEQPTRSKVRRVQVSINLQHETTTISLHMREQNDQLHSLIQKLKKKFDEYEAVIVSSSDLIEAETDRPIYLTSVQNTRGMKFKLHQNCLSYQFADRQVFDFQSMIDIFSKAIQQNCQRFINIVEEGNTLYYFRLVQLSPFNMVFEIETSTKTKFLFEISRVLYGTVILDYSHSTKIKLKTSERLNFIPFLTEQYDLIETKKKRCKILLEWIHNSFENHYILYQIGKDKGTAFSPVYFKQLFQQNYFQFVFYDQRKNQRLGILEWQAKVGEIIIQYHFTVERGQHSFKFINRSHESSKVNFQACNRLYYRQIVQGVMAELKLVVVSKEIDRLKQTRIKLRLSQDLRYLQFVNKEYSPEFKHVLDMFSHNLMTLLYPTFLPIILKLLQQLHAFYMMFRSVELDQVLRQLICYRNDKEQFLKLKVKSRDERCLRLQIIKDGSGMMVGELVGRQKLVRIQSKTLNKEIPFKDFKIQSIQIK